MFGLFKKKSKIEKLDIQYKKLLAEAHQLSTSSRKQSDAKVTQANEILKQINMLRANS